MRSEDGVYHICIRFEVTGHGDRRRFLKNMGGGIR